MKKRCYPKNSYITYFIFAAIALTFLLWTLISEDYESLVWKLLFSGLMLFLFVSMTIGGIIYLQYFYIEDNTLFVKTLFGIVTQLDLSNSKAYIEMLPTYSSWAATINAKWICIYDKELGYKSRFKTGGSNSKNKKRIQIIYNSENIKIIEKYIRIEK